MKINDTEAGGPSQMAVLSSEGRDLELQAVDGAARLLVLAGEPIDEPIVGYGPFVMNSREEIRQAIDDFNGGAFGRMKAATKT